MDGVSMKYMKRGKRRIRNDEEMRGDKGWKERKAAQKEECRRKKGEMDWME